MFRLPLTPAARLTLAAALLMALGVGTRSSFGLFVSPLNTNTGLGLAAIGLAAALGQLAWGAAAPLVGWLADRFDARRLIAAGLVGCALFTAALAWAGSVGTLSLLLVLGAVAGCAACSNALLLGAIGRDVPPAQRTLATGVVGAGGSAGQMVIAPLTTIAIATLGWASALWATAALMLLALPLARPFARPSVPPSVGPDSNAPARADPVKRQASLPDVLHARDFWLIAGAFGVCGFHVAFLTMHMPGVIERCGLPLALAGPWLALLGLANIAGSLGIAPCVSRLGPANTLALLFALRGVGVVMFISMPVTIGTTLVFALWMGLTYMAVLPPMNELLSRRFGVMHLSTLLGVTMVVHQVGAFAGVWMGGWVVEATGSYDTMWLVDLALAALAAGMYLPLRERRDRAPVLRAAGATDLAAVQAFVRGLSQQTRHRRFFAPLRELPGTLATALRTGDPAHHFVIAESPRDGVVALGQLARIDDCRAELALVVGDALQGQGLGRRMVERMLSDAAAMRLRAVEAACLAVNRPMLALLRHTGFVVGRHPDDGELMQAHRQLPRVPSATVRDAQARERWLRSNSTSTAGSTGFLSCAATPWRRSSPGPMSSPYPV